MLTALLLAAGLLIGSLRLPVGLWPDPRDPATTLASVEQAVSSHVRVPEITVAELRSLLSTPAKAEVALFDVREPAEFEQSHIAGAERIDPDIPVGEFTTRFGPAVRGKTVVFYCAVGVRSGYALERMRHEFQKHGAAGVYNLRGGIFRWFATGAPVVSDGGPVDGVHPYDEAWGELLRRTVTSYSADRK
jgi:rhodanese-related sulfurtransferase